MNLLYQKTENLLLYYSSLLITCMFLCFHEDFADVLAQYTDGQQETSGRGMTVAEQ